MEQDQVRRIDLQSLGWIAGLIVICIVAFLPALSAGFVWDDDLLLLDHPNYRHPELILSSLKSLFLISPSYFRPIGYLSFFVDYAVFSTHAPAYHAENLLIHICSTILVWILLGSMGVKPLHRFLASALFAVHPSRVEGVVFISSRFDLLATLFFLIALILHKASLETHSWSRRWTAAVFFLLALLSKEMAITFPIIAWLADRYLWKPAQEPERRGRRHKQKKSWLNVQFYIPYALAGIAYFATRFIALGSFLPQRSGPPVVEGALLHLLLVGRTFLGYVYFTLFPFRPTPVHYYPEASALDIQGWAGLVLLVVLAFGIVRRLIHPSVKTSLILFGVLLLPVLNLIPIRLAGPSYFAERFLYLPLLAVIFVIPFILNRNRFKESIRTFVICYILVSLFITHITSRHWHSDRTLFSWVVDRAPQSALGYTNLALEETREGTPRQAIAFSDSALARQPENADAWDNLGVAFYQAGALAQAESCFVRALQLAPGHPLFSANLAGTWRTMKRYDDALQLLNEIVTRDPTATSAYLNIGLCHLESGHPERALKPLQRAADLGEVDPTIWLTLAKAYALTGQRQNAILTMNQALRRGMSSEKIGREFAEDGRNALANRAVEHADIMFELAGQYLPDDPVIANDRGVALRAMGQPAQAESSFIRAISLDPDLGISHANLGEIAFLQGNIHRADSILAAAVLRWPDLADSYRHYGHVLLRKGLKDSSSIMFEEYLRLAPNGIFAPEVQSLLGRNDQ